MTISHIQHQDTTYINIQFKFQVNPLRIDWATAVWFCNQKQMPNAATTKSHEKHINQFKGWDNVGMGGLACQAWVTTNSYFVELSWMHIEKKSGS